MGVTNALGQPIGKSVAPWKGASRPTPERVLEGTLARVEAVSPNRHAAELHAAFATDADAALWTYLPYGPFPSADSYAAFLEAAFPGPDPLAYAVIERESGLATGLATYLRIKPSEGTIEIGHLCFSPALQGTATATEAMFLMMQHAFDDLGYRRYEWKCDALNDRSNRAARRLGFCFEGIFRQATVYKGRNRDTAWYAVLDHEWPLVREAYLGWLDPRNFDVSGHPLTSLSRRMGAVRTEHPVAPRAGTDHTLPQDAKE